MTASTSAISAQQLWFTAPLQVEMQTHRLPALQPGELLVATECSAVSAGTELLLYRGQIPRDMVLDTTLAGMQHASTYPLQYGYASAGKVVGVANDVEPSWLGQRVFAYQPHASHFISTPAQVIAVPPDITAEAAVFLANMETAVNLAHDGHPVAGEHVVVLGQGIVGLLLAGVLAQFPLQSLSAVDALASRRQLALQFGVQQTCDAASEDELQALRSRLSASGADGADLIYEVSGAPVALNLAVALSGYASRIVIGSWYGSKSAPITLGGDAHRNRLQISTSQVSTLAPALSGRWDKQRRLNVAWDMIRTLHPEQLITHRAGLQDAAALYSNLHQGTADIVQALFHYSP